MALYARLMGDESPKIPPHGLIGMLVEMKLGRVTGAQASANLGLSAEEEQEALALVGTITGTVQQQIQRVQEIQMVLLLAELHYAPHYATVAAVQARLGVS